MKLFAYRFEIRPQPGQTRHRLALSWRGLAPEVADRLLAAADANEALHLTATYVAAKESWQDAGFSLAITTHDGIGLCEAEHLPVVNLVAHPAAEGRNLTAEQIEERSRWISDNAEIRVIGAHFEPLRDDTWSYGKKIREGFIVIELRGSVFTHFYPQRRSGKTTHPVFLGGRFHGYAGTEIGADRALDRMGAKPKHGWKLKNTPIGRVWFPRSAEDVAHRLREVRSLAEPLAEACDKLRGLDLSEEPELARELAELLSALGRGGQADRIAHLAGVPAPRGR